MIKWIAEWYLKRKLAGREREVFFISLRRAKTALLLYDATQEQNTKEIVNFSRYLKQEGLQTRMIGYYGKVGKKAEKPKSDQDKIYYDKKEVNWLGFPKNEEVREAILEPVDLLVDLNIGENFSLQLISSLSKARFKVGPKLSYAEEVLDLSIDAKEKNLAYLCQQIGKYLEMINKDK